MQTSNLRSMVRDDVHLFGIPFWNPTYDQFHEWWLARLGSDEPASILCLANPNTLNIALSNPEYMKVLKQCDVFVNDGVGIRIASAMRGVKMVENFAGTDLMPRLFGDQERPLTAFFYGATEESNRLAVEKMSARYPNLKIVGRINGYVDPVKEALPMIQSANADLLMCALGQPKQEFFMVENRDRMNVKVMVTCGGMFDFFSETKPRAPKLFRALRSEWVYRLMIEPKRMWRRYVLGNPQFLMRAALARNADKHLMSAAASSENR